MEDVPIASRKKLAIKEILTFFIKKYFGINALSHSRELHYRPTLIFQAVGIARFFISNGCFFLKQGAKIKAGSDSGLYIYFIGSDSALQISFPVK